MDLSHKTRLDYFLIWGNGIQYRWEILELLWSKNFLEIIRIQNYYPKNIKKFVETIYSYDYAPFQHLKDKTRYLLKSKPEVLFIFVLNKNPNEKIFGDGEFRHIECTHIKRIKEEIRNKYNPRINGKRTEEHVVHATDNESQVDYVLKYLGYDEGVNFLKNIPNPLLDLPYFIPKFSEFTIRSINISHLYCNILKGNMNKYWTETQSIEESPQYKCLNGDINEYESYLSTFLGGPLTANYSVEQFLDLTKNLIYLEKPYDNNYFLVKEFRPHEYLIQDGLHRAAILLHRGVDTIPVAVIK